MGNLSSTTNTVRSTSPRRNAQKEVAIAGHGRVESNILPAQSASPPLPVTAAPAQALHLASPAIGVDSTNSTPCFSDLAPTIAVSVSTSPPSSTADSLIFSGRAATSSPLPLSPRSNLSDGSSVSSTEGRDNSFFWNLQEQYNKYKMARRQSLLESAGHLGRPCRLVLHSITVQGAFASTARIQAEVCVLREKPHQGLVPDAPPVRTPPRSPLRPGQANFGGESDIIILPSITTTSTLSITVLLQDVPIGTVYYPVAEVTATLRPTELRLMPGRTSPRSPSNFPLRRRKGSPTLRRTGDTEASECRGRLSPPHSVSFLSSPPTPQAIAAQGKDTNGGIQAAEGPPRLCTVWGDLTFYNNRSSAVGWVDVIEEAGKPVNEPRLLVVTPQSFGLLVTPQCVVGNLGFNMNQVRHVEPGGRSQRLPEREDETSLQNMSVNDKGGGSLTLSVSRPDGGEKDMILAVDSEQDARRWTQLLRRGSHDAAFGSGVSWMHSSM